MAEESVRLEAEAPPRFSGARTITTFPSPSLPRSHSTRRMTAASHVSRDDYDAPSILPAPRYRGSSRSTCCAMRARAACRSRSTLRARASRGRHRITPGRRLYCYADTAAQIWDAIALTLGS